MSDAIQIIGSLARLEIKPGDKLVLTCEGELSSQEESRIRSCLESEFPNNKVMVISGALKLHVVGEGAV